MREPPVTSWEPLSQSELGVRAGALLPTATRALVLVDGRSGAGKSTFARRLAQVLDAAVLHTDDIAWQHSRFDWSGVLLDGVITLGDGARPWSRASLIVDGTPRQGGPDLTWMAPGPLGA